MKDYIKKLLPHIAVFFIVFDILPITYYFGDTAAAMKILLLIVNPVVTIVCGFLHGLKNGFKPQYVVTVLITFAASMLFYYGFSAVFYGIFYCLFALLGVALGWMLSHISK